MLDPYIGTNYNILLLLIGLLIIILFQPKITPLISAKSTYIGFIIPKLLFRCHLKNLGYQISYIIINFKVIFSIVKIIKNYRILLLSHDYNFWMDDNLKYLAQNIYSFIPKYWLNTSWPSIIIIIITANCPFLVISTNLDPNIISRPSPDI